MNIEDFHISIVNDIESLKNIRNIILRPGQPKDTCEFPFDNLSIHLGLYIDKKLISIISFSKQTLDGYSKYNCWQFRGMATLTEYRKLGYGKKLLKAAIKIIKDKDADIFWCNARESALNFYKKLNFEVISDRFIVPISGPHYKMILKFFNENN